MARAFKFEIGDVVRVKEGDVLTTQVDHCNKVYLEHLTVYFRFWDGNCCCYVLNVGDDDICLISDEDYATRRSPAGVCQGELLPRLCLSHQQSPRGSRGIGEGHRAVPQPSIAPIRYYRGHHLAGPRPRTDTGLKEGITS